MCLCLTMITLEYYCLLIAIWPRRRQVLRQYVKDIIGWAASDVFFHEVLTVAPRKPLLHQCHNLYSFSFVSLQVKQAVAFLLVNLNISWTNVQLYLIMVHGVLVNFFLFKTIPTDHFNVKNNCAGLAKFLKFYARKVLLSKRH